MENISGREQEDQQKGLEELESSWDQSMCKSETYLNALRKHMHL